MLLTTGTDLLQNIASSTQSFFSFLKYVWKALDISTQYISSLPTYFVSFITLVVAISVLYLILGR